MFFGIYSTVLLVLLTIDISVNAVWGELMWINARDTPEGVLGYIVTQTSVWYQTLGSTTVVAMIFLGDALLVRLIFFRITLKLTPKTSSTASSSSMAPIT